jgi:arylformamidase
MIDISRAIAPSTAVWPGDRRVQWSWSRTLDEEAGTGKGSVNVGAIAMSVHTGTHVDAPLHFSNDGRPVDELPPERFVGPALVIDVGDADAIRPKHVAREAPMPPRVLFKTAASRLADDEWPETVAAFEPATIRRLEARGVGLAGTDAPSVDPLDSSDLPAHHALASAGIVNVEGLALDGVAPGRYMLYACPIRIEGADAAPVRALLGPAGPGGTE